MYVNNISNVFPHIDKTKEKHLIENGAKDDTLSTNKVHRKEEQDKEDRRDKEKKKEQNKEDTFEEVLKEEQDKEETNPPIISKNLNEIITIPHSHISTSDFLNLLKDNQKHIHKITQNTNQYK